MTRRNTRTGGVLEQMMLPALNQGGYSYNTQVVIGKRPGGGKHKIDLLAQKNGDSFLISMKWQQSSGTAEQKVPFEIISLTEILLNHPEKYKCAYLVLGGNGWTLRDFYIGGGLKKYLRNEDLVQVISLESFVALANKGAI